VSPAPLMLGVNLFQKEILNFDNKGEGVGSAFDLCEWSDTKVNIRECSIKVIIEVYHYGNRN